MKKYLLVAFNGDVMCFVHVLLNAGDMNARGHDVAIVIEGAATALVPELESPENPMHRLYREAKDGGVIEGVCRACSQKMGVSDAVEAAGLAFLDDMKGHPSMAAYGERGFEIITF